MNERPILFSGSMVKAILEGRKTQTRRPIRLPKQYFDYAVGPKGDGFWAFFRFIGDLDPLWLYCPYGRPGDRLWVRETWSRGRTFKDSIETLYRATHTKSPPSVWRPSIHMPRSLSRIILEITDIRVQRVQDINEAGARAEGVEPLGLELRSGGYSSQGMDCWHGFVKVWDDLYAKSGLGFDVNPWVWALTFKRLAEGDNR